MSRKRSPKTKTWIEVFQSERKTFPIGYCVTRIIPDKRNKKPKHKRMVIMEEVNKNI